MCMFLQRAPAGGPLMHCLHACIPRGRGRSPEPLGLIMVLKGCEFAGRSSSDILHGKMHFSHLIIYIVNQCLWAQHHIAINVCHSNSEALSRLFIAVQANFVPSVNWQLSQNAYILASR